MNNGPGYPVTNNHSAQVNTWVEDIAKAIEFGGTEPHHVIRAIVGRVYADGYQDGRVSGYHDHPLEKKEKTT